jgi:hypothetical protein
LNTLPKPENEGIELGEVNGINSLSESDRREFLFPEFTAPGHKMRCPHCEHPLTLKQAIVILNGSGFRHMVPVRLRDGTTAVMDASQVNPNAVEILDPEFVDFILGGKNTEL